MTLQEDLEKLKIKYAIKKYLQGLLKDEIPEGQFIEVELLEVDTEKRTAKFTFSLYEYPKDDPLEVDIKPIGEPTPYLIHCRRDEEFGSCGRSTFLTKAQYDEQLNKFNKTWQCPNCRSYGCDWDDENYEKYLKSHK